METRRMKRGKKRMGCIERERGRKKWRFVDFVDIGVSLSNSRAIEGPTSPPTRRRTRSLNSSSLSPAQNSSHEISNPVPKFEECPISKTVSVSSSLPSERASPDEETTTVEFESVDFVRIDELREGGEGERRGGRVEVTIRMMRAGPEERDGEGRRTMMSKEAKTQLSR